MVEPDASDRYSDGKPEGVGPGRPSPGQRQREPIARLIAASTVGQTVEFYDFFLYATATALVLGPLFFPSDDPLTGVLLAFVTYAIGFGARPFGGMFFGHMGDRYGRKKALVWTLMIMGGATFLVGLLPTYAAVGVLAPILLTLLRLAQGFALGGEWGGAVLLVTEHGSQRHRGFWAAWPQMGGPLGNLLSTAVLAVLGASMPEDDFLSWGWRIPFLLSAVLVLVGLFIRNRVEESPLFIAARERAERREAKQVRAPLLEVLRTHKRKVGIAILVRTGENAAFYMFATFLVVYATNELGDRELALNAVTVASVFQAVGFLAFGALSDRLGRKPVAIAGAVGIIIWSFVFFPLVDQATQLAVTAAAVVGLLLHAVLTGASTPFYAELFGTSVRYSGASLGYQIGSVLGGALAPIAGVALLQQTGSAVWVSAYIAAMALLSVIGMALSREGSRRDLLAIDLAEEQADPLAAEQSSR